MIKPKDMRDLFGKMEADIVSALDDAALKLQGYTEDSVSHGYRKECETFWPLRMPDGEEIPNPHTGEPFGEEYKPELLAYKLKSRITKDELRRIVRVWVDLEGHKNADSLEAMGRLLELYGCHPWGKIKNKFMSAAGIADVIK